SGTTRVGTGRGRRLSVRCKRRRCSSDGCGRHGGGWRDPEGGGTAPGARERRGSGESGWGWGQTLGDGGRRAGFIGEWCLRVASGRAGTWRKRRNPGNLRVPGTE